MSANWTDDRIRAYLLATLDQAGVAEFEERLLSDAAFARDLDLVETDLIDDYAAGRLTAGETERLEALLAERPRLQGRVAVAAALTARGAARSSSPWHRPSAWLAVAASLALLATVSWWTWRTNSPRTQESVVAGARSGDPAPPGGSGFGEPGDPRDAATPPSPPPTATPRPAVTPQAEPSVFAVLLPTGVTRGMEPTVVRIPARTARVLFRVSLAEGDEFPGYRVTLRDRSERVLARSDRLRPTRQRELHLAVGAETLPTRAEIQVEGLDDRGHAVDLAFLTLDIRR